MVDIPLNECRRTTGYDTFVAVRYRNGDEVNRTVKVLCLCHNISEYESFRTLNRKPDEIGDLQDAIFDRLFRKLMVRCNNIIGPPKRDDQPCEGATKDSGNDAAAAAGKA